MKKRGPRKPPSLSLDRERHRITCRNWQQKNWTAYIAGELRNQRKRRAAKRAETGPHVPARSSDGRFATAPNVTALCTVDEARVIYDLYLRAVCQHQGLMLNEVLRQLARPGRPNIDSQWRAATYARQLAMYLANTAHNVPQRRLADVTGLTPAAVCLALRSIEDVREVATFDRNVDLVAASMGVQA